jgi:hypothetical protein
MLRPVALVRTDVSEELSASIIRATRIDELRRLLVTSDVPTSPILVTLMKEVIRSSETSVIIRATRRSIPEDAVLHSYVNLFVEVPNINKMLEWIVWKTLLLLANI